MSKAYRTVSSKALCVITGMTPIHIKIEEAAKLHHHTRCHIKDKENFDNNKEGMVWYSVVWYWCGIGMVWYWYGMVWYSIGMVWYDVVWYWYGMVWHGMVWYSVVCYW